MDAFSSSIAFSTSASVDPNRSPITFTAWLIAFFILMICSSGVIASLLHRLRAYTEKSAACPRTRVSSRNRTASILVVTPNDRSNSKTLWHRSAATGESNAQEGSKRRDGWDSQRGSIQHTPMLDAKEGLVKRY